MGTRMGETRLGGCFLITQVVKAARMDDGGGNKKIWEADTRKRNKRRGWWVLSKK